MREGAPTRIYKLPEEHDYITSLKVGDIVYISGKIFTARDRVHKRIYKIAYDRKMEREEAEILKSLQNTAIYHCGPIIKRINGDRVGCESKEDIRSDFDMFFAGNYRLYSGGPTTSARMEKYQKVVCSFLNVGIVIGKGGMPGVDFSEIGGVYLAFPGGCGAVFSSFVKKVVGVLWESEFGMPEALWVMEVEKFGPLIVAQDSYGGNLYRKD